jgi:hypothetical protein
MTFLKSERGLHSPQNTAVAARLRATAAAESKSALTTPLKTRSSPKGSGSASGRPMKSRTRPTVNEPPPHVVGPIGERLTLDRLPRPDTIRWTVRRKAEVVAAVGGGLLTFEAACARYSLAMDELINWQRAIRRSGMRGLRVTRLQQYRDLYERRDRG